MCTPHISATREDFAKTVLMPGDPLRAKHIANNYLVDVRQVNKVRNVLAFTGKYKNKPISIMASGMGQPSIGIYSYELYTKYDVENIIRIGTCGSFKEDVKVKDIILVQGACTDSNYIKQYNLDGTYSSISDWNILKKSADIAQQLNLNFHVGNVLSSDIFYHLNIKGNINKWSKLGVLAVEMESSALFINAAFLKKRSHCILTVSDSLVTGESLSSQERQESLNDMFILSLETAISL